jgi:hypothetical protein
MSVLSRSFAGGGQADQGPEPGDEIVGLGGRQPGHGRGQVVDAEHLPLQQALAYQVRDYLANDRLSPGQMRRGFADGERTGQRQMLKDGPGRAGELTPRPVPAMKRQVDGPEELGTAFRLRPFIGHVTRVAAGESIVNTDRSPALAIAPFG